MTALASEPPVGRLAEAGLPADEARSQLQETPGLTADFSADRQKFSDYWARAERLLACLPRKPRRSERDQAAAALIFDSAREARARFLRRHGEAVYDALTMARTRFVRVEELVLRASEIVPGL